MVSIKFRTCSLGKGKRIHLHEMIHMEKVSKNSWLVIRTFNRKEMEVSAFLKENALHHFIPMTYKEKFSLKEERPRRVLVPVIHNYVFLQKPDKEQHLKTLLAQCRVPLQLMHNRDSQSPCEIDDQVMTEFRLLCDPDFNHTLFVEPDEAEAKPGKEVVVVHGPFAGVHGKLHKTNQKYYFIKTVGGISVMIHISRWYCKVLDAGN